MPEISKEYASALFELASEEFLQKEFLEALRLVNKELSREDEYYDLLSSPNIPTRERVNLIEQAFLGRIPEYVLSFTELICENGYIKYFTECVNEYEKMYETFSSVSAARIVSAIELSREEKEALTRKLEKITGNKVVSSYEIDRNVIGGVVIYIDDKVIDGSISRKLNDVKEVISE